MKSTLVLIISLFVLGIPVHGQIKTTYQFGITGGLNAAQIKNDGGLQKILWRYNGGIVLEQRFSPAVSLVYQLLYSRQGERVISDSYSPILGGTTRDKQIILFDYLTLPIMVRFRPKGERVFLELGSQIGYMLYNKFYWNNYPDATKSFDHPRLLDAGITGGLGYRLGKHLVVDGRYYHGSNPILADYTAVDPQTGASTYHRRERWYNRVYQFQVSYFF